MAMILFLGYCSGIQAQDRILMKRGDTLTVRLIEVKQDTVRFKNVPVADTSQYIVLGKHIRKIIFEDGHEEKFDVRPQVRVAKTKIPFDQLLPITMKGASPYTPDGLKLQRNDLLLMFNSTDNADLKKKYNKVHLNKALALSSGMLAIPPAVAGVFLWANYSWNKTPERFGNAVAATVIYALLESGFIYFNVQASRQLKKSVAHYNNVIAKHQ